MSVSPATLPTSGLWLAYTVPSHTPGTLVALYDWTNFVDGMGWSDTAWQLRCIAADTASDTIYCPLVEGATYLREYTPKVVSAATAADCTQYNDAGYFCTSTQDAGQASQQYCTGTWKLYLDGAEVPPSFTDSATQGNTAPAPWVKVPKTDGGYYRFNIGLNQ